MYIFSQKLNISLNIKNFHSATIQTQNIYPMCHNHFRKRKTQLCWTGLIGLFSIPESDPLPTSIL